MTYRPYIQGCRTAPVLCALVVLVAFLGLSTLSAAQVLTTLYYFNGSGDAIWPNTPLTFDSSGNLYGASIFGGTSTCSLGNGCGTVFELSPPSFPGGAWTEQVIYSFKGGSDGSEPQGQLVIDKKGVLYGTTEFGGTPRSGCQGFGCGTLFQLIPPSVSGGVWTKRTVHAFSGGTDGSYPAGLVLASDTLYGAANSGGAYGSGNIYSITFSGGGFTQSVIYNFNASLGDAGFPYNLFRDSLGNLYGTSTYGGAYGLGSIYELSPPTSAGGAWTEQVLYSSPNFSSKGYEPGFSLAIDSQGSLWGTMTLGGASSYGAIYRLHPPASSGDSWVYSDIYNIAPGYSTSAMVLNHSNQTFYGVGGGGNGTIYQVSKTGSDTPWTYSTIYSFPFDDSSGDDPFEAPVLDASGNLYGTTEEGGLNGDGTVWMLTP